MRSIAKITLPIIALLFCAALTVAGQATQDPQPNGPPPEGGDLIPSLHLTPDQLQKIRQIQHDTKDERSTIGLRLRESNRALEDALDAENFDEGVIEQRMQAVEAAQNAQLRLRIQTEMRIRRLLNPEQLAIWRDLRLKAGNVIRRQQDRRALRPGVEGLRPNQRNGLAPLGPRRNPQSQPPRP